MNFSLADEDLYLKWRDEKFYKTNIVIYKLEAKIGKSGLLALAAQFYLSCLDKNLCANDDGISVLEVNDNHSQEYIPYLIQIGV